MKARLWSMVKAGGKTLNVARLVIMNIVFWGVLLMVLGLVFWGGTTKQVSSQEPRLLRLELAGNISDAQPDAQLSLVKVLLADEPNTLSTPQLLWVIQRAAQNPNIKGIVLDVDQLNQVGPATVEAISNALRHYKEVSKNQIYVWASRYSQAQYLISMESSEIFMHPLGSAEIKGVGGASLYWGQLLKNLGVGVTVYKAGDFKSAPEVFVQKEPSQSNLLAQKSYLDDTWKTLTKALITARKLPENAIEKYWQALDHLSPQMTLGRLQVQQHLVDQLMTESQFQTFLNKKYGPSIGPKEAQITAQEYLENDPMQDTSERRVAVLVAQGTISSQEGKDQITPQKVLEALKVIRQDPRNKALVLRLNTPGGEVVASEDIRELLALFKQSGIPVVVSMSDVTASGGYWISTVADKIVAEPTTLTGSIGVFGLRFDIQKLLEKSDVGTGGYSINSELRSSPYQAPSPLERQLEQTQVNQTYLKFLTLVSESRKLEVSKVHEVAQGRVWTGAQAKKLGLVDELGGLNEAIALATKLANIPQTAPKVYGMESMKVSLSSMVSDFKNQLLLKVLPFEGIQEFQTFEALQTLNTQQPLLLNVTGVHL